MDVVALIIQFLFRCLVVVLPMTVAWLALRRLAMSSSANAWIYAAASLFGAVTSAGLLPWALGLGSASWLFFVFSAFCPALWLGVVLACDARRPNFYEAARETVALADRRPVVFRSWRSTVETAPAAPLILENPEWPGTPVPFFRHARAADTGAPTTTAIMAVTPKRTLLSIARDMRRNETSDARRPKLLPAPYAEFPELPFLKTSGSA